MNRRERRAMKKSVGADASQDIANKVAQFGKLPQKCDACQEPFDKADKTMLQSWSVVVKQETVRLFCPECIRKTQEAIENVSKENL
jgi:ribosomal protein L44E